MQLLGRHREACQPLALACSLRPEREDYRQYRDRARRDATRPAGARELASDPSVDGLAELLGAAPMLCSIESFRAGVQSAGCSTESGRTPAFFA